MRNFLNRKYLYIGKKKKKIRGLCKIKLDNYKLLKIFSSVKFLILCIIY